MPAGLPGPAAPLGPADLDPPALTSSTVQVGKRVREGEICDGCTLHITAYVCSAVGAGKRVMITGTSCPASLAAVTCASFGNICGAESTSLKAAASFACCAVWQLMLCEAACTLLRSRRTSQRSRCQSAHAGRHVSSLQPVSLGGLAHPQSCWVPAALLEATRGHGGCPARLRASARPGNADGGLSSWRRAECSVMGGGRPAAVPAAPAAPLKQEPDQSAADSTPAKRLKVGPQDMHGRLCSLESAVHGLPAKPSQQHPSWCIQPGPSRGRCRCLAGDYRRVVLWQRSARLRQD